MDVIHEPLQWNAIAYLIYLYIIYTYIKYLGHINRIINTLYVIPLNT